MIEPLVKIEKDMDRLEEKIRLSEKAVKELKGDATGLDKTIVTEQSTSPQKTFLGKHHDDEDGCKFSKTPSGLSSDVKVSTLIYFII